MTYEKINNNQISQKEKDLKLKSKNYLFDELDAAYRTIEKISYMKMIILRNVHFHILSKPHFNYL